MKIGLTILSVMLITSSVFAEKLNTNKIKLLEQQMQRSILTYSAPWALTCRAVLISSKRALTSAHCNEYNKNSVRVILKSLLGGMTISGVLKVHPNSYKVRKDNDLYQFNDLATIDLDEEVAENEFLKPVKIDYSPVGMSEVLIFDGWKNHKYFTLGESNLVYGKVMSINHAPKPEIVQVSFLENGLNCGGHSGGPVFRLKNGDLHLVGTLSYGVSSIKSWGDQFGCSPIGGFTALNLYAEFIEN